MADQAGTAALRGMVSDAGTVEIRRARSEDAESACRVLRRSIAEICAPYYDNDEGVLSEWLANKTPDNVRAWIESDKTFCLVAVDKDKVTSGFAVLSGGVILLLYLLPEALYQGTGKRMLQSLEDHAVRTGIQQISLMSSIPARAFYERNGYVPAGEPEYVGPVLGHFPMSKDLAG